MRAGPGNWRQSHAGSPSARKIARRAAFFGLVTVCVVLLAIGNVVIVCVPLRRMAPWLGVDRGPVHFEPIASCRQMIWADRFGRAIEQAARYVPFRADCYPQAIAAFILCAVGRIPAALHFGARLITEDENSRSKLEGHTWLTVGHRAIVGGNPTATQFAPVACFVRPRDALSLSASA